MLKKVAIFTTLILFAFVKTDEHEEVKKAYCVFVPEKDSGVTGHVTYT